MQFLYYKYRFYNLVEENENKYFYYYSVCTYNQHIHRVNEPTTLKWDIFYSKVSKLQITKMLYPEVQEMLSILLKNRGGVGNKYLFELKTEISAK